MKKIISLLTVVILVVSMFSFSAIAADAKTVTLAVTAEDNKANVGDEFIVSAVLNETVGVKDMQIYIEYDPNDFVLGTSDEADALDAEFGEEYVGEGKDYATLNDLCLDQLGYSSYVDTTYYEAYGDLKDTKKWSKPEIGAEIRDGNMNVMFAYMKSSGISKLNNENNVTVAGAVLKVNTTDKKQATITIKKSFTVIDNSVWDKTNTTTEKLDVVTEDVTLNLNGYGEVVEEETPAEKINLLTANGVAKSDVYVTNNDGTKYYVDSALVFVSSVDKGNAPVKTVITCDDFADTKLEIEATHTQDINGLTYFAAAMSSIKETNYGRTFKATAYVTNTAGEEVVGAPATGIFTK